MRQLIEKKLFGESEPRRDVAEATNGMHESVLVSGACLR